MPTFAVLIDVENIRAKSLDLRQLVEHFSALGQIAVCRAVACSGQFSGLQKQLDVAGFEKIEYPRHARKRNRADIHIVIDAVELLWTRPDIDSFVLVSGDSDFVPLVRKLQSFQRRTIVLGNAESTAKTLKAACDEFLNIERFTRQPGEAARPPAAQLPHECMSTLHWTAVLLEGVQGQFAAADLVYDIDLQQSLSCVNSVVQRLCPSFRSAQFGFPNKLGFKRLLARLESAGMCHLRRTAAGHSCVTFTQALLSWPNANDVPANYQPAFEKTMNLAKGRLTIDAAESPRMAPTKATQLLLAL